MTAGAQIADAVRLYLAQNGLKQSQLTGAVLAEIACAYPEFMCRYSRHEPDTA